MSQRFLFVISLLFIFSNSITSQLFAQGLTEVKEKFTKADTLRGTLSPLRTCYDVKFYDLHITLNPDDRELWGYNDITFAATNNFVQMQIDLFDFWKIDSIVFEKKKVAYQREFNAVLLTLPRVVAQGERANLRFYYSGKPMAAKHAPWDGGFSFSKDPNGKHFIGVSCQGLGASSWYPNKDHQSDEPDSMHMSCAVPNDLYCFMNGQFRGKRDEVAAMPNGKAKQYTRYNWAVTYPINNYAVSLNIADYTPFSDIYLSGKDTLHLHYYPLSVNADKAKKHFEQVKPMLKCYEERFGRYPFWRDGFALVETPYLGMEHQSGIAYGNNYKQGYTGFDITGTGIGNRFDYIIIHEAGHEWWGNSVTSADIADMWIHEGFCTYGESMYVECMYGKKEAITYVNGSKKGIENDRPIIGHYGVNKEGSGDMYGKGAVMLNCIRSTIDNDSLWFAILKGIANDFKYGTVNTEMIVNYINKRAGKDLTPIFDQYLRYTDIPVLEYRTQKRGKNTELSYRWVANAKGFNMPMKLTDGTQTLQPNAEWQKTILRNTQPAQVAFANDLFYFEAKLVK
jgi:aminopeptidase N